MIDSTVRLPNGHEVTVSFPEGTSDKEIKDWVLNEYVLNRDPGSIFGRSIAQGIDDLQQKWGSSLEGLGNVIDAESLSRVGGEIVANNQNEIEARRYREQQYTTESEGFQKGIDYVAGLVGQSAPQMATTMAGALAGAKIGAVGGPLAWATVPAGAFMGGFLVNMPFFYGDNRERQKEAIERGYRTEMDEGAAALTAIPQSSLDSILGAIGAKFIATPLMKIQGGILTKAIKGSATGSIIETPTELGQQVLNRYQSGLPIDDDEAIREYVDAAIGGAVLGGLFGGAGGAYAGIRGEGEVDQAPTGQEEQAPRDEMRIEQPSFAEPVADEALRYRVTYTDEFTGEEAQLELEALNPEDAINKVATGLGLEASGMQVETIFPFAEPEVAPTEPEVAAVEPEVIPTEPGVALAEPEVMPTEPMVTPAEPTVTQAEPEVTPRINEPSGFKFSKDEGKPDPKYSGGATVNYANDFSRAVRISPNSKIFKKVRERLKKDYELTDSELDALRKKANDRLLQQKRAGKPLSLDMTKDLPSRAPIAPEVAVEPEVTPTEPKVGPPAQDLDVEAIREQESIVSDADARIMELESEVDIEKSNIKEARAENKKKIAEVRKSNLSKEEKQERVEDLKAELQDTIDDINGNIGIYKEEISAFKSDKRKAAKKLSKLTTPAEPTIAPEEEAELQAELQQEFLSGDQDVLFLYKDRGDVTAGAGAARRIIQPLRDIALPIFEKVKNGLTVTAQESQQLASVADKYKPVTKRAIPEPETTERMRTAHKERKAGGVLKRDLVGAIPSKVKDGDEVASRLDIPSYNEFDTWTVTVHEKASNNPRDFNAGDVIGYDSTLYLTDATFGIGSEKRGVTQTLAITKGAGKGTIATIRGKYKKVSPEETKRLADQFDKDPAWTQVGMDPERRNYFYNREDGSPDFMREVLGADEVIQVGPVVLAKNVKYGPTPSNEFISRLAYDIEQDVTAGAAETDGEPKKTTRGYDLLDSPFIEGYSGDGPSDTSIPDYDSFHYVVSEDQRQKLNAAVKSGAIDNLADQVAEEAAEMVKDPEIAAGIGWYGRMRTRLKQIFGQDVGIFTQLLGTTSAQTPVETNFRFSVDLYNRFKAGEFDAKIKEYLRLYGMMKSGKLGDLLLKDKVKNSMGVVYTPEMIKKSSGSALLSSAAEHYNLVPRQPSGKKYGTNSYPALKALAQVWFDERLGKNKMTPKTPQFTMNLNGESLEATIDVWAARLLRRVIYKGQEESRIFPSEETAVSNPDFALGQLVFRRAAQRMNMNPDDLQALVWFGEKQIWDENGWTGAVGALKSSFDEPADVFYPVDGSTRSEADAKLILDFLAKERLVKRDIAFPDTISKTTQANNRRDYDQLLRTSVIIDYLKSRGSGAVYESRSVESDRKRQITRSINRLSSYTGKVSYKKGTGEEPTRSLKVVRKGPVLGNKGFVKFAKANKDGHKFGSSVDVFEESNYEAYDLIITSSESGQGVTLAISPDGELSSVTRSPGATQEDVNAAFDMAISTGKVKFLNGFETILPDKYASYGFTPVARLKFDPTQQPPGWSYETYKKFNDGKPDVIFMRFDGTVGSEYNPEGFPEVQSYEAGIEAALTSEPTAEDVTAPTAEGETVGRRFPSIKAMEDFVNNAFLGMAKMLGIDIVPNYTVGGGGAQYNATRGVIEYNPRMLLNERSKNEIRAIFREEIIHAAMHNVLMKRNPNKSRNAAWLDFMGDLGRSLTQAEKDAISGVYLNMDSDVAVGSEYSRAVIQQALYGEITESYASKAFKKLLNVIKSVQSYMARVFGGDVDIDPEVAQVIRDSAELVMALDPSARLTNQKVVQKATDIANMAEGNQELTSDVVANAGKPPSKKAGIGFFKKYLFTPSVIMDNIHPELSRLFHKFFNGIDMETLAYMKRMAPFIKKFNAIKNEKDKRRLKQLIYYSPDIDPRAEDVQPRIQERTALLRKYGMLQDYEIQVRSVLNAIRQRAIQQGMDVAFLNDFFPRLVLDLDSIREYYGETIVKDFSSYIERINEVRRKELDPKKRKPPIQRGSIEEAIEFEKYIRSGEYTKSGAKPRNTKARTIEFIDDEILDSYADPGEAVEHYIHSMILSTRTMQLLGRRYEVEGENILFEKSGELGALIQRLVMNNEIDEETAFRTIPQFARMILNPVMKENAFLSNLRSFGYLTLLVEPTSTLSNLFDLPFVMYQKGFLPTLSAMLGKKAIRLEDIGIDPQQISLEFKSEKKLLAEAVRIGLKSTGFTRLDQLLKETNLNANYNYYRKLSSGYLRDRSSTASKKLKVELDFLLGEDADAAIAAFAKGDRNNALVREVVLRKILETQPLNRMEIPLGQSENANKRMLYSMKSFQVKQLNFVVSRMLSKIFSTETSKAERAAALKDLSKLMFFMLLVGMPVDALKDLLAGRIGYLSDYLFNSIFRIAGVSRYTAYQIKREGVVEGLYGYFTPVGMQQIADIAMELQLVLSGKKAITDSKLVTLAPFSDVINRLFGFTKEREMKEYKRRIKKGESPILVPPGSLR